MNSTQYYNPYSTYLQTIYGEKVYKLPINLNISCPNRMDSDGCTFCSQVGTGFEAMSSECSVTEQLLYTKEKIRKKYHAQKYIAYFQNYTNTFIPLEEFKAYVIEAVSVTDIVEIAISTRPDCIQIPYLEFLKEIQNNFKVRITIELGLQTPNYHTLDQINRGHGLAEFLDSVLTISPYGFDICTHLILNLPGDDLRDACEAARIVSALPIRIVKLHSLYIPQNTVLYSQYENGTINLCSKEEYLHRLTEFIALLRPDMVVERLFSRVPQEYAVFSNWDTSWWKLRDEFEELMKEKQYTQGIHFNYLNGAALQTWRMNEWQEEKDVK